jgi:hypothetical protein
MKALVISNRMDSELEERLSQKLGLDITWAICDMRRAQAQAKAISKNKYDLVIAQTGFLSHNVETIMSRACNANQVPYIRANKARPTSTAMALIRDLGLDITKEPPRHTRIVVSAPPQQSRSGKIRRRTIVNVPQEPADYKDLDIDILKFLEKQKTYFSLGDLFRALPGVPLICTQDGQINWNKMRPWMNAIGQILRKLNYVNAQIPQAIDPKRPRVWIRRDRQSIIQLQGVRDSKMTPAEIARHQPPPRTPQTSPAPRRASTSRRSPAPRTSSNRQPAQTRSGQKWLRKYEKMIRAHAKRKLYVHPEDILRLLGVDLPEAEEIVWQNYMFWTKNTAPVLRKMGFTPRQREFDGRKTRVWVHKSAPRYMFISPPGEEYVSPYDEEPAPRVAAPRPGPRPRTIPAAAPPPAAQAPSPTAPTGGSKAVRISFSSISGGDANELLLALTQAGWNVSFGP